MKKETSNKHDNELINFLYFTLTLALIMTILVIVGYDAFVWVYQNYVEISAGTP